MGIWAYDFTESDVLINFVPIKKRVSTVSLVFIFVQNLSLSWDQAEQLRILGNLNQFVLTNSFATALFSASNTSKIDYREPPGGGKTAQCLWNVLIECEFQWEAIVIVGINDFAEKSKDINRDLFEFTSRILCFTALTRLP